MTESNFSSDSATAVTSQIQSGRDTKLDADQDLAIEGGQVVAQNDVSLTAGRDISVESAKNNSQTSSSSNSISASGGVGLSASAANGVAAGVQVSGAASGFNGNSRSDSNTNAEVAAGQNLTVKSGQDTTIAGANLEGNKVGMDVGGNLTVASRQDTSESKSSNWSVGGTATVGAGASFVSHFGIKADDKTGNSASIGSGKSEASSAWVGRQTSIKGKEEVDIHVDMNTHVEGAVIAAENGNLKLDTDTLTYKDIYDHDKASNYQASVSVSKSAENAENSKNRQGSDNKHAPASPQEGASKDGGKDAKQEGNPYSGTLDGSASSHDRRQINRATIGEGEIIIRSDPDAGLEGLNRDLAKAQEITKDEKTSVSVYIDGAAIDEVASGGAGIKGNIKKLVDAYEAYKTDLPDDIKSALDSEVEGLGESAEGNMKEMIRQGIDPDVALELLHDEQYQKYLINNAKIEAKYKENPKQFLQDCGIAVKDGETAADIEAKAAKALQWLASLPDNDTLDGTAESGDINSGENVKYGLGQTKTGEYVVTVEEKGKESILENDESRLLRNVLMSIDSSGTIEYVSSDLKSLTLQGLMDARRFIDSIPAEYVNKAQAALLGMQLATGGPAKVLIGYAIAMVVEKAVGDKIEMAKDAIAEEVAVFLDSAGMTNEEYKLINCPNGDCSDKFASAGSYNISLDKDNLKFGMNIIAGTVGSILSKKVFKSKYGKKVSAALKRFPDDAKPNLVVNGNKQKKHILGTNEYKTATSSGKVKSPIDPDIDIQGLVAKYAGTGIGKGIKGQPGYTEVVCSNVTVSEYIANGVNWGPTKNFTIHCAKDGVHIVPAKP
ncbi:hemagglutinin repeat-containing protein [Pseudodesulfovibrio sp.]|uniref:hemagglutinin repeat-containing protein n=1 Tax=unclassified Pseudodesulfovibrio TaxID=2661612 RepID=UPI003B00C219